MKEQEHPAWQVAIFATGFAGIFLILAGLVWIMYHYTQPPPPDTEYWAQRTRNLAELNAQNNEQLQSYGWLDANRGQARLPIARAMELTLQEWQNPAAGRSNLLARLAKWAPTVPALAATNGPAAATNAAANPPAVTPPK